MDAQKVDLYLMTNQKYFPAERIPLLKEKLMSLPEDREIMVTANGAEGSHDTAADFYFPWQLGC